MNINEIKSKLDEAQEIKFFIEQALEEYLHDETATIEDIDGDTIYYRTGTLCRCSNGTCWYEYGYISLEHLLQNKSE